MSHPFQKGVGGTVMSYPKGACPKGGSTNHNQGEGVGAHYVNVALQNTVSPRTVLISKRWVPYYWFA